MQGPDGLLVIDKPGRLSSSDVVVRVRRLTGTRRVGHAGTLDPMATGVLVLGLGRATRLLGHLLLAQKEYDATIRLGAATTTDDADGERSGGADASGLQPAAVVDATASLAGDLMQVPSAVSAVKVGGRRAYARVRAGEAVVLEPRAVRVERFEVRTVRPVPPYLDVDVSVTCSSGTYVRALARDLGEALGVGGHLTALRRTRVGPFRLAEAVRLELLAQDARPLAMADVASRCFPSHVVAADAAADVRHGRPLRRTRLPDPDGGPVAIFDEAGSFLALYEQQGPLARAVAVFAG